MRSNIELPFSIGDRLYYVTFLNTICDTSVAFIEQYRDPVEGVRIDRSGTPKPVISEMAIPFGTLHAAASKKDALRLLAAQRPGTVYMDGRSVKNVFYANGAVSGLTGMRMTRAAIKQHVTGPTVTDGPEEGLFVIQPDAKYRHSDDLVSGCRLGPNGRVTHMMTGPFLCMKTAMRPDGLREVVDISTGSLPYVDPRDVPDGLKGAYSPEYWTELSDMTVEEFTGYLCQNFPKDAYLDICGLDSIALHFSPYHHTVTIDSKLQSDLPEYQGHEPKRVKGESCDDDCDGLFDDDDNQ